MYIYMPLNKQAGINTWYSRGNIDRLKINHIYLFAYS